MNDKKRCLFSLIAIVVVSIFPTIFLYTKNVGETGFKETILPMAILVSAGIITEIIVLIFTKSFVKSSLITVLFIFIFTNYMLLENVVKSIFPILRYWHILPIFIFILLHISYFIQKKMPSEMAANLTKVISFSFGGLIVFNLVMATPIIIQKTSFQIKHSNKEVSEIQGFSNNTLPNIYYILLDEYSGFNTIKKVYDYDNSEFAEFLENRGFTVSKNSHNESIQTYTVMTNIANLNYIVDNNTSVAERSEIRQDQNALLFKIPRDRGYEITGLPDASFYGIKAVNPEKSTESTTIRGENFTYLIFNNTIVSPFIRIFSSWHIQKILNSFEYMKNPKNFPENAMFTMFHITYPHEPFVFDNKGVAVKHENYSNWADKKYYLNQYIYCTKQTTEMIESIVKNDPNSIIILQSDHSARMASDPKLFLEVIKLEDASNILNAVYFKGEQIPEIEGQSGLNTVRLVYNKLFNLNFELLEVPTDDYKYK